MVVSFLKACSEMGVVLLKCMKVLDDMQLYMMIYYYYLVSVNSLWLFLVRNLMLVVSLYLLLYMIMSMYMYSMTGMDYWVYIWTLVCLSMIMSMDSSFSKLGVVLFMIYGFMCVHLLFNLEIMPLWVGKGLFWYTGFRYMNFLVVSLSFCTSMSFLMYMMHYMLWGLYPQKDLEEEEYNSDNLLNLCCLFMLVIMQAFLYSFHMDFQHYCYMYINKFSSLRLELKFSYIKSKFIYHMSTYIYEFLMVIMMMMMAIYVKYPFIYMYWPIRLMSSMYSFMGFSSNNWGAISKSYSDHKVFNSFNCKNNNFMKLFYHYYVFESNAYIDTYMKCNYWNLFNVEYYNSMDYLYFPATVSIVHMYSSMYSPHFNSDMVAFIHPSVCDFTGDRLEFFSFLYYSCPELYVLESLEQLKKELEVFFFLSAGDVPWMNPMFKDWSYMYTLCYSLNVDVEYFVKKYYPKLLYTLKPSDLKMYKKLD